MSTEPAAISLPVAEECRRACMGRIGRKHHFATLNREISGINSGFFFENLALIGADAEAALRRADLELQEEGEIVRDANRRLAAESEQLRRMFEQAQPPWPHSAVPITTSLWRICAVNQIVDVTQLADCQRRQKERIKIGLSHAAVQAIHGEGQG